MRVLLTLARPLWHYRVTGAENIDAASFPAVFVCNHDGPFGPIAAVMYLPTHYRPWVYAPNLDRSRITGELYSKTFSQKSRLPDGTARLLSRVLAGPVHWALTAFDPIPVWRDTGKGILRTLTETASAMAQGENILLFPENRRLTENGRFPAQGVGGFYNGFPVIAQRYTAMTGKPCTFYPCYADRVGRAFRIGTPLSFCSDGTANRKTEREEIAHQLHDAMAALCSDEKK